MTSIPIHIHTTLSNLSTLPRISFLIHSLSVAKSSSEGRVDASRVSMLCTIPTCVHKNALRSRVLTTNVVSNLTTNVLQTCQSNARFPHFWYQKLLSVVTHATQIIARCDVTRHAKLEAPTTSTKAQSDTDVIHRTGRSHELSSPYAPGCITLPRKRHFGIGNNTPRAVLPDL